MWFTKNVVCNDLTDELVLSAIDRSQAWHIDDVILDNGIAWVIYLQFIDHKHGVLTMSSSITILWSVRCWLRNLQAKCLWGNVWSERSCICKSILMWPQLTWLCRDSAIPVMTSLDLSKSYLWELSPSPPPGGHRGEFLLARSARRN